MQAHQSHVVCLLALKKLLYSGDGAGIVQVWELQSRDQYHAYYNAVRNTFTRYQPKQVDPLTTITQHRNTINALLLHDGIRKYSSLSTMQSLLNNHQTIRP